MVMDKLQTPAQRIANAVWLRDQLAQLITSCEENIADDQALADQARDDNRVAYLARVESHAHWKRQLERILRGKTFTEELRESVKWKGLL